MKTAKACIRQNDPYKEIKIKLKDFVSAISGIDVSVCRRKYIGNTYKFTFSDHCQQINCESANHYIF